MVNADTPVKIELTEQLFSVLLSLYINRLKQLQMKNHLKCYSIWDHFPIIYTINNLVRQKISNRKDQNPNGNVSQKIVLCNDNNFGKLIKICIRFSFPFYCITF